MIGFYAFGGGFGHLSRVSKFIQKFLINEPFKVLTNNFKATYFFDKQNLLLFPEEWCVTKETLVKYIRHTLQKEAITTLYIDVFPSGILGELNQSVIGKIRCYLLARRMLWEVYKEYLDAMLFEKVFVFEDLEKEHQAFIKHYAKEWIEVDLYESGENNKAQFELHPTIKKPFWLIVHTSNQEELNVLWHHAVNIAEIENVKPNWVILSDKKISTSRNTVQLHNQNPINWFPHAERIISAAGFNTIQQLKPFANKSITVPFPRKFDDQFWRAQEFRKLR